ncbi:vacuolar calcium ion transporter /H(+) exchanger [Metarhizium robertsii ARSEF 23]|uniref:Vacuolar calcium ion transporter /H(+) exchanger n=1 Tax=Metarhizium robertsii (strain ARSEF 23 / ATCC MYA-3075) TaxID=655844 RepID=E9FAK2_METRA|nr:vacuolar calcium ion transporter /H(+) exchanger [Metarhizium robertsii ARSEF 23]EFY95252.2 vacuolar calcium ion transporter /H(+) exchanger [Metarhizium robertsii ARSEF 23]
MPGADSHPQLAASIRARRRAMAEGRAAADDAEAPERDESIPPVARTQSMFLRMRTETHYQEIATLLQELYSSPTKALLVFAPAGIAAGFLRLHVVVVFALNFIALVPLSALVLYTILAFTADYALLGGLLRAVFGNATELTLGMCALLQGKAQLAQWIMIGSILTYCLFVLGFSFLVASYGKKKEPFSRTRTSIMSSLVMSGSICLAIPTVIAMAVEEKHHADKVNRDPLFLSRATSLVQMFLFLAYLVFRFRTHNRIFPRNPNAPRLSRTSTGVSSGSGSSRGSGPSHVNMTLVGLGALAFTALCSYYLVRSLAGATKALGVSESFAALVVVPQAGSLMKAVTIIRHTRSSADALPSGMGRLDFAIRSIMTNVFDTELFILPMLVLLGWAVGEPMKLSFGLFEAVIFLMAILTMTYLVQHGKTTYFEGIMLMGTYVLCNKSTPAARVC